MFLSKSKSGVLPLICITQSPLIPFIQQGLKHVKPEQSFTTIRLKTSHIKCIWIFCYQSQWTHKISLCNQANSSFAIYAVWSIHAFDMKILNPLTAFCVIILGQIWGSLRIFNLYHEHLSQRIQKLPNPDVGNCCSPTPNHPHHSIPPLRCRLLSQNFSENPFGSWKCPPSVFVTNF